MLIALYIIGGLLAVALFLWLLKRGCMAVESRLRMDRKGRRYR